MSVYLGTRWESGIRIVFKSAIKRWPDWPDDVRDTMRQWNREHRLSFVGMDTIGRWPPQPSFKCPDCSRFINPSGSTACRLDDALICDDCIIKRARNAVL